MSNQTAAIIHSILYRKGGTHVTLDGTKYHFIDDDKGRQVAPVANPDHVERFLQIPEGYKLLREDAAATSAPATPMGAAPAPQTPTEPAKAPQQAQGQQQTSQEPQQQPPAEQNQGAADKPLAEMSEDELRATFEADVGRKPHPQAKPATLISQIEAAREDKAGAA